MIAFLNFMFVVLAILIIALMIFDAVRYKVYLISVRNTFLVGFIVFQVTSPIYTLATGDNGQFELSDPEGSGLTFLIWASVFFGVFYLAYPRLPLIKGFVKILPITRFKPGASLNIAIAVLLTIIAIVLHFGVNVPLVGVLARFLAISFAAIASGLAAWVWAPRLYNPVYAMMSFVIVSINCLNVITGSFGRRELVAVLGCFMWGMFYSKWREARPLRAVMTLVLIGFIPTVLLALYTSVRSASEHDRSAGEHIRAIMTEGSVSEGMMLLLNGQSAGGRSMWLIENFPENFEQRPLFTMRYAFMLPVPRAIWIGKPPPLAKQMPYLANMLKVHRDRLTVGPGIVGHAAAEGGWYALIIYAIILAYVCRFFDEVLIRSIDNPLIVLPMGSALGQVLGMPRGETGVFMFILVFSVVGSYICLVIVSKFLTMFGFGSEQDQEYLDEWNTEAEDGFEYDDRDPQEIYDAEHAAFQRPSGADA